MVQIRRVRVDREGIYLLFNGDVEVIWFAVPATKQFVNRTTAKWKRYGFKLYGIFNLDEAVELLRRLPKLEGAPEVDWENNVFEYEKKKGMTFRLYSDKGNKPLPLSGKNPKTGFNLVATIQPAEGTARMAL